VKPTPVKANFDGNNILLDETLELEPDTKRTVTVLPTDDLEREEWLIFSGKRLEDAYDQNEIEYSLDLIKEVD
jgi:hypothetical protein